MSPTDVLSVFALCLGARGFNLGSHHSEIITDPTGDLSSYFGYSLGFWQQTSQGKLKTWLLVGAPKGQVKAHKGERIRNSGVVYKCPMGSDSNQTCEEVSVLEKDDTDELEMEWRHKRKNIPAGAWIGETIAVENKPDGGVIVCGPRMMWWTSEDNYLNPGICYYWKADKKAEPLKLRIKAYQDNDDAFIEYMNQNGFSAEFVKNTNEILIGSPGKDRYIGALIVYKDKKPSIHQPSRKEMTAYSYIGYSVTSGKFHRDGSVSYIAGAPRGDGVEKQSGVVHLKPQKMSKGKRAVKLRGHQMGEYFGATVATLDINIDGVDDLLVVGAPLHCPRSTNGNYYDLGVVYVYGNKGEANLQLLGQKLTGSSVPGARFGSSLAVVGDIDKDGFTDLAVGAPYEGSGVVYLYRGQDQELRSRYSQRIAASDIESRLRGFGISISAGQDIDGNSFKDIAVGSHESSNAVVIKSYPVIDFKATFESSVKRLDMHNKGFSVKACLRYTSRGDPHLIPTLKAEISLKLDSVWNRAVFRNPENMSEWQKKTLNLNLTHREDFCWPEPLNVNITKRYKLHEPIVLSLEYKLLDSPSTENGGEFCERCSMTDPLKPSSVEKKVPFALLCNATCNANLNVEGLSSIGNHLVLGEHNNFTLKVTVKNTGEPAYQSTLAAIIPGKNMLLSRPNVCDLNNAGDSSTRQERFLCNLGNLLGNNAMTVSFEVDLRGIDLSTSNLVFKFYASSASEEIDSKDNSFNLSMPIRHKSDLNISGRAINETIDLLHSSTANAEILVIHKYEVFNYGPSPASNVQVDIRVPKALFEKTDYKEKTFLNITLPQITTNDQIFTCIMYNSTLNDSRIDAQNTSWSFSNSLKPDQHPHPAIPAESNQSLEGQDRVASEEIKNENTLHLNCSGGKVEGKPEVVCLPIRCVAGPLAVHDRAEINLKMTFIKSVIESLMNNLDAIKFETSGFVKIVDHENSTDSMESRVQEARAETAIIWIMAEEMSLWIIILAIAIGLLTFLPIVKGMSNMGFFRRGDKEKLKRMKEEIEAEEEFDINDTDNESANCPYPEGNGML